MSRFDALLVANRGEIACRIIRSASAMGIRTVALFADSDADALHVLQADEAVRISSYPDGEQILAAARLTSAGAVHPGYGFLAENAAFAEAVLAEGLVWVGPSPEAIALMGDKIAAKKLAVEAGIPVLESSDDPSEFASLGFPILIKAAAGGGGKGMRVVDSPAELEESVAAARREALAGFGDDRVFAERCVRTARHIEIQVLGDRYGDLLHLGERECSIQRRHQKIIEESPSPFVSDEMRSAMGAAAVSLARALSYESAGTVEFLVDDESGEFFFLEVNTRLQVEHPVTEEVTGVDLVREQLRVARGEALGYSTDDISFTGHAIEARLCSEDPDNDFLPATGVVEIFEPAVDPPVRYDTGVQTGSAITSQFDPMIAKVISHAATRADAAGQLALALERLQIGGVATNRDFLAATLRSAEFLAGETTTDFIERFTPPRKRNLEEGELRLLATAAAMWLQYDNRSKASVLTSLPSGFRIGRLARVRVGLRIADTETTVYYSPERCGGFVLGASGDEGAARVRSCSDRHIDVEVDSRRRRYAVARHGDNLYLTGAGGGAQIELLPRFPIAEPDVVGGAVVAPMPGRVIDLRVGVGDVVEAQQVVAVIEAMKMEHHLRAAQAGTVTEIRVSVGDQIEKDVLLMVVQDQAEEESALLSPASAAPAAPVGTAPSPAAPAAPGEGTA
ncbi:MAG: acetyl-CoA carboxylase biotin carboxylase subunit [Acidimicrobiaceae bacterium]|nr:acetyl-CoA carboxylase biotin carboxylase subunit [Acidimicrobiaceae bacterium]